MIGFNEWMILHEGKRGKKGKTYPTSEPRLDDVETMRRAGKITVKLSDRPVARGHQQHLSGAGTHDDGDNRQRQNRDWRRDQGD